jgi:molybdate/tungstate transport system permease protein
MSLGTAPRALPGRPAPLADRLGRAWAVVGATAGLLLWVVLLAPLVALLAHLQAGPLGRDLTRAHDLAPLGTSVLASLLALGALVVLGLPLAWVLARHRGRLARTLEAGLLVPLAMPPLVIGLLLVFLVGPESTIGHLLGSIGASATNTFLALVIAELYEAGPYFVLGAAGALAGVDVRMEEEARLLGHRPFAAWRRVTLPLAAPGLASALAIGWARAIGAFGAVIVVAYHPYGLPMRIWVSLEEHGLAGALPFALILLLLTLPFPLLAYAWSSRAQLRRLGAPA